MALPIRLIVGPDNLMEIPLEAQSLDVTVNRNASAFPTPNNIVGRVAIDTNVPEIDIEIGGIFQDEVGTSFDIEKTKPSFEGGDIVFNFASIVPTSNLSPIPRALDNFVKVNFKDDIRRTDEITDMIDIFDTPPVHTQFNETREISDTIRDAQTGTTINHPSSGTYAAGSTSIAVSGGTSQISIGQRIHLSNGTFVGVVTNDDGSTLTLSGGTEVNLAHGTTLYNYKTQLWTGQGQVVGSVIDYEGDLVEIKEIKLDSLGVPVYKDVDYYLTVASAPPVEALLNNKKISIFPNYWRIDGMTSTRNLPLGVHLVFSTDRAHSDFQNQSSGGAYPTVIQSGRHNEETDTDGNRIAGTGSDVYIKVPIGGITSHAVNGNPASTLALIVKKALELTDDIMIDGSITSTGGQTLGSAFTVTVGGPMLKVKQKDRPISNNFVSVLEPCLQFDASENFDVADAGTYELAQVEFFTGGYVVNSASVSSKSAGDKVQDLIGIVSNAKKNRDLIRGIQIPYDSLIQSDAVTPTARNFFLTFGQQDNDAKGSSNNSLSASHTMIPGLLPGDLGGDPLPDRGDSFFDNITEFGDAVMALAGFVGNFIGDTFVTLLSNPHGNDGGIRIIPEKLHVRYDAGNKYYAFTLKLKASDFVIGV
jgi:hypothetical protein